MQDLLVALSLVFIIEGMFPFISPPRWRALVANMTQLDNRSLRTMGLVSMVIGLSLLFLLK